MAGVPSRLTAVTLGARSMSGLRRFYRDLGWEELPSSDDNWAGFLLGGVLLTLYPADLLAAEAAGGAPAAAGWSGITLICNVDRREQVDPAFAAAVAVGASSVEEPVDRSWGGRSAYFADPEGNRWEIAWAPGLRLDARGAVTGLGG
ncbi:VOC family protein [Actinomadura nitritigenes]|uniref:VOC family protein n=1 Tax=Actinomadura nitritigenes TaxID=134602 RepID=UPI003D917AEB